MERERLGSRLGFILLSAGCAIGVGNVWKFPYMVGQNGGGAFVVVYLLCLVLMGLPVMSMEFALGRASQVSPVNIHKKLTPEKKPWRIHGKVALVANIILMMFYTVVAGWILNYCVFEVTGKFEGMDAASISNVFGEVTSSPSQMILYTFIIIAVGAFVCSFSLQGGLERVTKYMMIALLLIMIVIAIHGFTLDGASEGLSFYLIPDFSKIDGNCIAGAMNQAFFTLSLGIGSMAIFGSYIGKDHSLMGESVNVIILDTFVAIVAGLIIFPACFTYGIEPDAGPNLLFVTLPNVFANMSGGRIWGALFFIFMTFAAFSTVLAVFEAIMASIRELTGWSKKKTSLIAGLGIAALSLPCILGFNLWSGFQPFGLEGKNVLDLEDFLVSNCALPLGSISFLIYCTQKCGWGWDNYFEEVNTGSGIKLKKWMRGYISYIVPICFAVIFIIGMIDYFK